MDDKKQIFGWAMYDWANSAYMTTVAAAVLPIYFANVIVGEKGVELFIQNANDVIKKKVTTFRYKKEYFRKRVINSISSLIKRRGILFIRPRHFKMLFSELKAIFSRNGIKKNS